jgi:hypothetical protein
MDELHRYSRYDGGANHIHDRTAMHEMQHAGSTISMVMSRMPVAEGVEFDGTSLILEHGQLPDTALSALVGRRLGDLVEIDPVIDGRIIQAIHPIPPDALGNRKRHAVHVALPFEPVPLP